MPQEPVLYVNGSPMAYHFAEPVLREPRYRWIPRFLSRWYKNYWIEYKEADLVMMRDVDRLVKLRAIKRTVIHIDGNPLADDVINVYYEIDG